MDFIANFIRAQLASHELSKETDSIQVPDFIFHNVRLSYEHSEYALLQSFGNEGVRVQGPWI